MLTSERIENGYVVDIQRDKSNGSAFIPLQYLNVVRFRTKTEAAKNCSIGHTWFFPVKIMSRFDWAWGIEDVHHRIMTQEVYNFLLSDQKRFLNELNGIAGQSSEAIARRIADGIDVGAI